MFFLIHFLYIKYLTHASKELFIIKNFEAYKGERVKFAPCY